MNLTKENVLKIAENARLHLTDDELEKYAKQLNEMFSYVTKIQEINTENVEATTHGNSNKDVLRADTPVQWQDRDKALENAPDIEENYFKVPTVID